GCFKVCYSDDTGTEFIVKFALENWWVVDLESFINQTPSFFYIQAIEDSKVLQLSRSNYDKLLRKIPAFHKFSNERWQNGFIALQHRIMHDQSMTAEERYRRFKEKYPTLEQRIPQKLIAAYLGITSEFLSMIRKKILIS
ncbi:MAG TPA: Crp/Fnr family transcriptional regulator, partial [bacterium]|nr:Crp/Fnr family transcriptional regulator [bacterium]